MFTINIKFVLKDLQSQHLTKKLWLACGDCRNHLQGFKTCCRHFIDFIFANKTWFTQIIIVIIRYQKHAAAISWNTFGCSAVRFMATIAEKDPFWGQNAVFLPEMYRMVSYSIVWCTGCISQDTYLLYIFANKMRILKIRRLWSCLGMGVIEDILGISQPSKVLSAIHICVALRGTKCFEIWWNNRVIVWLKHHKNYECCHS